MHGRHLYVFAKNLTTLWVFFKASCMPRNHLFALISMNKKYFISNHQWPMNPMNFWHGICFISLAMFKRSKVTASTFFKGHL